MTVYEADDNNTVFGHGFQLMYHCMVGNPSVELILYVMDNCIEETKLSDDDIWAIVLDMIENGPFTHSLLTVRRHLCQIGSLPVPSRYQDRFVHTARLFHDIQVRSWSIYNDHEFT